MKNSPDDEASPDVPAIEVEVISVPEFLHAAFKKFGVTSSAMYRGVKDADNHKLISKAGRTWLEHSKKHNVTWDEFTGWISAKMQAFTDKMWIHAQIAPVNEYEGWALAQHHGFPTYFLDWTLNPLIALFFAVDERSDRRHRADRGDAAVYAFPGDVEIFRPEASQNRNGQKIMTDGSAYAPRHLNSRITAQQGVLTYHITADEFKPKNLVKFRLPTKYRTDVLQQLALCGISEHFVYQDFDGLGADLHRQLGGG